MKSGLVFLSILRRGKPRASKASADWRIAWDRYLLEFRSSSYNFLSKTIMSESKDDLRFDGRVAIVTGAGGGKYVEINHS